LVIDLSIFSSMVAQLAVLDISSSSIKLVELSIDDKGAYKLERYGIEPLPRDAVVDGNINNLEAAADAVGRALRRFGALKSVAVALPAASVITKRIVLPEVRCFAAVAARGPAEARRARSARQPPGGRHLRQRRDRLLLPRPPARAAREQSRGAARPARVPAHA